MSWVSLEDVLGLAHASLFDGELRGAERGGAEAVRQADFARTLGRVLSRPAVVPVPALAVKTLFGKMGEEVLLAGAHVRPEVAERLGFPFIHPKLEKALRFTLGKTAAGPQFTSG